VDPYRPQIARWLEEGLTAVRMLELARQDPARPYTGSRSQFGEMVRRVRRERAQQRAAAEVPIRFEGLPGEYLQVDGGGGPGLPLHAAAPGDTLLPGLPPQV
jgi:hypothetical protein